jgi:ribose transport system ATP-binding protein
MLEVRGLTKVYDAITALDHFDFQVNPGDVIGVIGENGAGKSTLMKLLSGVISPTAGEICLDGVSVKFKTPGEAQSKGIAMVHQELNLIPTLSVEDNLFLGREKGKLIVSRKNTRAAAQELLKRVGAQFAPHTLCEDLSVAEQQLIEIAKTVAEDARLVIFDEPTAVLSNVESEQLFELIQTLKSQGVAILYVSHRLPEVLKICNRIVVLRDGQKVTEADPATLSERDLANLMVGRELNEIFPPKTTPASDVAMEIPSHGISVRMGEIVGIGGLIGSGRTEFVEALCGLRGNGEEIVLAGQTKRFTDYSQAIRSGVVYVSEDRKGKGLVMDMSVQDNICLADLKQLSNARKRAVKSGEWIETLTIKVPDAKLPMTSLSGGNQQKCSVAKWLQLKPTVLILDEPTRGVDVGAKAEIYQLIADLAKQGLACILISSELPELIGMSHRVYVFREGRVAGQLENELMNEREIMGLAAGVSSS